MKKKHKYGIEAPKTVLFPCMYISIWIRDRDNVKILCSSSVKFFFWNLHTYMLLK